MSHAGIILYTYHKYQRAIDSPVPLDAHGNPIAEEEEEELLGGLELEETDRDPLAVRMSMGHDRDIVRRRCFERYVVYVLTMNV
jgi:solute carrier family 35 protein C2